MVFSSVGFLFYFLPLAIGLHCVVPKSWRNGVLFVSSLVFYAWGEPIYVLLMLFSTLLDYSLGLAVDRWRGRPGAKWALVASVAVNLSLLGVYKYAGFFVSQLNALTGLALPVPQLSLPIGISFYTFQTMSYTIDVYRDHVRPQRNLISFGAFVSMFPQLIAGPIVRYADVEAALYQRQLSLEGFSKGIWRFLLGLAKKLLFANAIGLVFSNIQAQPVEGLGALTAWLGIVCYFFQIYYDFSGYSDMAIGLGKMLSFDFPENFRYPYAATSVTDFWRRWHMTLSSWFRDYVYIPLGGNRHGKARQLFNLLITWLLTGFWHGASWNFVLWGLYYFAFLALEKLFLSKWLDRAPKFLGWAYTLLVTLVGWVLFAFESLPQGLAYLSRMFGAAPLLDAGFVYAFLSCLPLLVLMALGAVGLPAALASRWSSRLRPGAEGGLRLLAALVLLLLCTASVTAGSYNPFLYFRF